MGLYSTLVIVIIVFFHHIVESKTNKYEVLGKYFLEEIDSWGSCSKTCGEGYQEKMRACFKMTYYMTENVPLEMCENVKNINSTVRNCNYGSCDSGYVWKSNEWSKCSHTCGNEGAQMRESECFRIDGQTADPEMCDEPKKPKVLRNCNRYNCPPEFSPKKWGPCVKTGECSPGRQTRELSCLSLLNTGKVLDLPRAACSVRGIIPPASWKSCEDHIDTKKCNKIIEVLPEITSEKRTMIQMKRTRKINLQAGFISYIMPGTTLSLTCPVKNFLPSNIVWSHKNIEYLYRGKSKSRLRVTKKGKMILKTFLIQDQGEWVCKAGNATDKIVIKLKSPSDGFKDWAIRNALWNEETQDASIQLDMMQQEIIRWVTGPWSQCSVSCEDIGFQNRMVQCEILQRHSYQPLDDDECIKRFGEKPTSQKKCSRSFPCPKWKWVNPNSNKCTDRCIDHGKALLQGNLKCIFKNQSVESYKCDSTTKPIVECDNPSCFAKWKISSWTKCSRSCGQMGIQARYLICIWDNSEQPAGNVCYKMNLPVPQVIRPCKPPKCNLKCIDMMPNCKRKSSYCRIGLYSYRCCKTCRDYFSELRKTNK